MSQNQDHPEIVFFSFRVRVHVESYRGVDLFVFFGHSNTPDYMREYASEFP